MNPGERIFRGAGKGFVLFAVAYALFTAVVAMLAQVGLPDSAAAVLFALVTLSAFAAIGLVGRTMQLPEFQAASGAVSPVLNGMATAAAFIASAGFLGIAGTFAGGGETGIAVIAGWTLGFLALSVLIAPYFRKSAALTAADFLAIRYGSRAVRIAAVLVTLASSLVFLIAEMTAAGVVAERLLGLPMETGIAVGCVVILAASLFGGMQALTLTAVAQYIVIAIAFVTPVAAISFQTYDIPLPQVTYGYAIEELAALGAGANDFPTSRFLPVTSLDGFNMLVLALSLAAGIASMPHLLMRSAAAAGVGAARRSAGWALLFVLLIAATAPAYAAFTLLAMADDPASGVVDISMLVLDFPALVGLSAAMTALVAAGALAAILATAAAILFSIANTLGHDIYSAFLDRNGTAGRKLVVTRIVLVATAVFAAWKATEASAETFEIAATSLSLAASGLFPALFLGIWWKRATAWGALAGILVGFAAAAAYVAEVALGGMAPWQPLGSTGTGLPPMAAAFFGLPLGILTIVFVSQLTREPTPEANDLVDAIRRPSPSPVLDAGRN